MRVWVAGPLLLCVAYLAQGCVVSGLGGSGRKATEDSQCGRLFTTAEEKSTCNTLVGLYPKMPDNEMLELVFRQGLSRRAEQYAIREEQEKKKRAMLEEQEEKERVRRAEQYAILEEQETKERARRAELYAQEEKKRAILKGQEARNVAKFDAATKPQRQRLADEYQKVLSRAFSNYNYIEVETKKSGDGFALYGKHSFFSKYTFEIGPEGPLVNRWVDERARDLRAARIRHVGVQSDSGDATYYTVP